MEVFILSSLSARGNTNCFLSYFGPPACYYLFILRGIKELWKGHCFIGLEPRILDATVWEGL